MLYLVFTFPVEVILTAVVLRHTGDLAFIITLRERIEKVIALEKASFIPGMPDIIRNAPMVQNLAVPEPKRRVQTIQEVDEDILFHSSDYDSEKDKE